MVSGGKLTGRLVLAAMTTMLITATIPVGASDRPCLLDRVGDAIGRLQPALDDPAGLRLEFEAIEDLDGDGWPENLVTFRQLCGAHNCVWAIYGSNDGCLRYVGQLSGSGWIVESTVHNGMLDLSTSWRMGCAGAQRYEETLTFNGEVYESGGSRYIDECPKEDTRSDG